jgi:hypothetical protein
MDVQNAGKNIQTTEDIMMIHAPINIITQTIQMNLKLTLTNKM